MIATAAATETGRLSARRTFSRCLCLMPRSACQPRSDPQSDSNDKRRPQLISGAAHSLRRRSGSKHSVAGMPQSLTFQQTARQSGARPFFNGGSQLIDESHT